jgi:hypothetical protein
MDTAIVTVLLSCLQVGAAFYTARAGWKMSNSSARDRKLVTTQEAIRRADILYWLKHDDPEWVAVMNENLAWHRVNEVHLSEEAAAAFLVISNYKSLQAQERMPGGNPLFEKSQEAVKTLRAELLKFR